MLRMLSRFVLILLLAATPAFAESAQTFIGALAKEAVETIPGKKLKRSAARGEYDRLIGANFDVAGIGRSVLGEYWNQATAEQRKEYLELYRRWAVDGVMNLLGGYRGETVQVSGARQAGGATIVTTRIQRPGNKPVSIHWHVRKMGGAWKIVNLSTDEGDLITNHRTEFRDMIELGDGSVEYLIEELRIRTGA